MAIRPPHWRKLTWVIIFWCALTLFWAIGVARTECEPWNYCELGKGISLFIILGLGSVGFIVLSLIWFMTRPNGRMAKIAPRIVLDQCPQCEHDVKKGETRCELCGYKFMKPWQLPSTPMPPPPPH